MQSRRLLWLTVLPICFTLLASVAGKYPFQERLVIFLVPAMLLPIACSLLATHVILKKIVWFLFAVLLIYPFYLSAKYTVRPPELYDVRPALEFVSRHYAAGDTVYLHWGADVVGSYYISTSDKPILRDVDVVRGKEVFVEQEYADDLRQLASRKRVWVVFAMCKNGEPGKVGEQQKVLDGLVVIGVEPTLFYDDRKGAAFLCSFETDER